MQNNENRFSMEDVRRLSSTPAGQELMKMLNAQNMDAARRAVQQGDFAKAKDALGELLKSPKVQQLLREMEKNNG